MCCAHQMRARESGDDCEDVASRQDEVLLAAVLELRAAVLRVDDLVAHLDVELDAGAVVCNAAGAHGHNLTLLRLLLGCVRDDQTGRGGLLCLDLTDDDAILERLDGDRHADTLLRRNVVTTCAGTDHPGGCRRGPSSRVPGCDADVRTLSTHGVRVLSPTLMRGWHS